MCRCWSGRLERIALLGFMGAGKTTVGMALARFLGWRFLDLDTLIESDQGLSIPDIFARRGEDAFRAAETAALAELDPARRMVLAVGGGAPIPVANRHRLRAWRCVYLTAPFSELRVRVADPAGRPMMRGTERDLLELYRRRAPIYRLLGVPIDTAHRTVREITAEIASAYSAPAWRAHSLPPSPAGRQRRRSGRGAGRSRPDRP